MALRIFSVFLLLSGLIGMSGSVTWILRKGNSNRVTILFTVCQIAIVLWIISQLLILFSVTSNQLWISYIIGNIGISIFSPCWLMFCSEFINIRPQINRFMKLLPIVTVLSVIFVVTNPMHRLYYAEFGTGKINYGILFYVFQVIYYICIVAGITMMCIKNISESDTVTKQTILLTLSTAIPLAINTLTVTKVIDIGIELTPLFFGFSSIMILLAIGRFGLLNINRIAINDTIDNISGGVMVFDSDENISYMNKYACDIFPSKKRFSLDEFVREISRLSETEINSDFVSAEVCFEGHFYNLRQNMCLDKSGRVMAKIIVINNVTEYYELAKTENRLSIERERNRIAQEIHDSAGHTFTMISSLARTLSIKLQDNPELTEYLDEIDGLSRSGVTQLRCSINNLRDDTFMTSVTGAVRSVADSLRNISADVCIQGTEDERYSFCIREVYDNCRETITNAMRYSGAEHIDIIVKFLEEQLEIYILDNGRGCSKIKENNGLRGIRERTESLGGTVRFISVSGEGFTTIMKIPLKV